MLLVVNDPESLLAAAVAAGATQTSPVTDEQGWRLGRFRDPFEHEWELGRPLIDWPPPPRTIESALRAPRRSGPQAAKRWS